MNRKELYLKNLNLLLEGKYKELDKEFLKDEKIHFCNKIFYLEEKYEKVLFKPNYNYSNKLIELFTNLELKSIEYIYLLTSEISIYVKVNEMETVNFFIFEDDNNQIIVRFFDNYKMKIGNVEFDKYSDFNLLLEALSLPNLLIHEIENKRSL